jgi:hypothetical protein
MAADVVRHEVLVLAAPFARAHEHLRKALVAFGARLLHLLEHGIVDVLGRDRELAARVVLCENLDELGAQLREVVPDARCDERLFHALFLAHSAQQPDERAVVGDEVLAHAGINAAQTAAGLFDALVPALHLIHVRRGAADVGDHARKSIHPAKRAHLTQDALFASRLNDAPLVLGDRAKAAAAETTAHGYNAVLDRFVGGNGLAV